MVALVVCPLCHHALQAQRALTLQLDFSTALGGPVVGEVFWRRASAPDKDFSADASRQFRVDPGGNLLAVELPEDVTALRLGPIPGLGKVSIARITVLGVLGIAVQSGLRWAGYRFNQKMFYAVQDQLEACVSAVGDHRPRAPEPIDDATA